MRSVCSWYYFGVKYHLETPYTSGRYEATIAMQYHEYIQNQILDYVFSFFSVIFYLHYYKATLYLLATNKFVNQNSCSLYQTCQQMMWALEYDPDIFFAACEEAGAVHKNKVSKSKLRGLRHFGKWDNNKDKDKENTKTGSEDGEDGPVPISVFMVASVLKEKREKLLQEARGLDDLIRVRGKTYQFLTFQNLIILSIWSWQMTTSIYDRIVNLQCNSCFHFLSDIE